jgi:VanZ family protein
MPLKPGIRIFGRFVFFVIYAGIIVWLSLAAHPPKVNIKWLSWDKIQHAGAYFFLTFFAGRAFLGLLVSHRKAWRMALAFSVLFGICMEIAQSCLTRVRTPDKYDIAANILGAAAIYLLACLIPQISGKPLRKEQQISPQPDGNTDAS